jgi:hypothetical protein
LGRLGRHGGVNEHRRAYGSFDEALRAWGGNVDSEKITIAKKVIDEVTAVMGRPPDARGFTVPTSRTDLRVTWGGIGQVVLHVGFIHCRFRLDRFGPPNDAGWHELTFPDRSRRAVGSQKRSVAEWRCSCPNLYKVSVAECTFCGDQRP